MRTKKIWTLAVGAILGAALLLGGCASQKQTAGTDTAGGNAKVWLVGTDALYPPFGFKDDKTGDLVGFDVDIINAIAKEEGYTTKIQNLNFDGLIPAMQTGSLDIAISDMTITEERGKTVAFTAPYYKAGTGLVVGKDNTTIHSFKDLPGKRIGVSIGATGAEVAHDIKDAKIREFNTIADAFLELKNGGVDAVINDTPVNEYYVATKGKDSAKTITEELNIQDLGIAVKKGNGALLTKLDEGLKKIKANGEYQKIYIKWFGKEPPKDI